MLCYINVQGPRQSHQTCVGRGGLSMSDQYVEVFLLASLVYRL